MVYEEVETVKKIQAKDYKLAVDVHTELETKLKGKSARQIQLENQYNVVCQSLSNAAATKAAAEAYYSSLNTAMLVCGIMGFVFSIIMIIGMVVEVLGLFCSMGSITLILYIFVFANVGKRQTLKFQIDTMTDTLSRNANERDRLEVEIQRVIKEENARRTYLNNTLVKCNDVVDASNQYLTYDTQSISRLLYVMMCNDIGESKPVDRKLFDIRQRVFQKVN